MKTFPRPRPSDAAAIEARAAAWLAQRDAGLDATESADFVRWCTADPRHAAAVARLEATWSALRQLREYRPTARALPDRDLLAPRRARPALTFRRVLLPLAAAAAVTVTAVWTWRQLPLPAALAPAQVYTTTVSGYQRLALADGSVVELNDRSELRVLYSAHERRVRLVRGEAHFTVAKNRSRPFFVDTPSVAVRAVGTAFAVRLAPAQVEVLVTEGTVALHRAGPIELPRGLPSPPDPTLTAGGRALVPLDPRTPLTVERLTTGRIGELLAWQSSRLVFVDTPLAEVVAQFNRRNQLQVALGDADLGALPVGGSFRAENVEGFVRLLASNGDVTFERPAPGLIVLRKAR